MTQNLLSRIIALHVNDPLKMSQSLAQDFLLEGYVIISYLLLELVNMAYYNEQLFFELPIMSVN